MTTETTVNGNTVLTHDTLTHRWLDAFGPDVCKFVEEFVNVPFASADNMAGWTTTLIENGGGESTVALVGGSLGGEVLFTSDVQDNDGCQAQAQGEAFYFAARYPTYVGARFKVNDATNLDAIVGLCITDSTLLAGLSDGLYFRKDEDDTTLYMVAEKDSKETAIGLATMADDTWVIAEMLYQDGVVKAYINGVEVGQLADSDPNFPDDEYVTPSAGILTGDGSANTMNVDWIRVVQVQAL